MAGVRSSSFHLPVITPIEHGSPSRPPTDVFTLVARPAPVRAQAGRELCSTIPLVEVHPSARKHGIADEDIEHATRHAMAIEDHDDTRLYLGPSRSAELLEVVTIVRDDGSELAITR